MLIDNSGRLGLGVTPEAWSSVFKVLRVGTGSSIAGESGGTSTWFNTNAYYDGSWKRINTNTSAQIAHTSDGKHEFKVAASGSAGGAISWNTAMIVDNSGNVLVGKTSTNIATSGCRLGSFGAILTRGDGAEPLRVNRTGSDGDIIKLDKDGTTIGFIGVSSNNNMRIGGAVVAHAGLEFGTNIIYPMSGGSFQDAACDLGYSNIRFKNIYRSGSTYSTSDRNMKQDIRDLTDAERNVALACKGLLKAFRFIDNVEKDGDNANIHFGVIAQELAEAFEAEGLDANHYQVYKSATYTDENDVEQTRLNVCYENLLAFIIAAI